MKVKPLIKIVQTWGARVAVAGPAYTDGIKAPAVDWAQATIAAKDNYNQGVQAAISNDSFSKGVAAAGTAKWQTRAIAVGASRWISGVQASAGNYHAGMNPYIQILTDLTLPPRGPAGSPSNIERVRVIAEALHNAKIQRSA